MNLQFMKRCEAQDVGIPINTGTAYGVGNSEGCATLGYASTCTEVSETNPANERESNSFAQSLKGFKFFRKLAIAAILAMVSFQADAGVKYLVVNFNDGVQAMFPLADNPVIRNSADEFTVETDAETISVLISELRNYEFSETTSVNDITEAEATYSVTPYSIAFEGLSAGIQVDVYDLDGRKQASSVSEADGSTRIDISALCSGVYVVTYLYHSFKFVKK